MTDNHSQIFFGQATGLSIQSSSKEDPYIFLRCIKKKSDGSWEKPSKGEGKTIRCSLEEIVMMLEVLNKRMSNWTSYHSYKDTQTQISFGWENRNGNKLWINIGNYSKMLIFAQIEIFKMLLEHLLKEKIKFATIFNGKKTSDKSNTSFEVKEEFNRFEQTNIRSSNNLMKEIPKQSNKVQNSNTADITQVEGVIKSETEKALFIQFNNGQEVWFPKSTVHSNYSPNRDFNQKFLIDNWILRKNKIIS